MMPETLRHRLAWQQHFMEEDWVLESYATEDSMPKTPEHLSKLSARLSNSDRRAHVYAGTLPLLLCFQGRSGASPLTVCCPAY